MKIGIVIGLAVIFAVALLILFYVPGTTLEISVTEVANGVTIQNVGSIACLVFVSSPNGEQRFELSVGQGIVLTDITKPIEVSAVSK